MKKLLVLALVAGTLASCGTARLESLKWHRETSMNEKSAYFKKQCKQVGFKNGTSEMLSCINTRMTASRANAQAVVNAVVFSNMNKKTY